MNNRWSDAEIALLSDARSAARKGSEKDARTGQLTLRLARTVFERALTPVRISESFEFVQF